MDTNYFSLAIKFLRPLLLLLVIFNHCTDGLANLLGQNNISSFLQIFIGKTITPAAVSSFFVISGYLYFLNVTKFNSEVYFKKTKKRIKTLAIPYFLWNLIGVLALCLIKEDYFKNITFTNFLSQFWCCNIWNEDTINILGNSTPLYAPVDWPLWYLRDLIVLSLLSPIIYYIIKKIRLFYFFILIPLYVLNVWTIIPGFGISSFLFFGLGVYLSLNNNSTIFKENHINNVIILSSIIISILAAYLWMTQGITTFSYSVYTLATIFLVPSILIIGYKVARRGVQVKKILISSSFFVYAFHDFPGINPIIIINKISQNLQVQNSILLWLVTPFIVYVISVLVYYILNKFFPQIMHVMTGR